MQQLNTQSVDKKRKNIYAGLDEENGRSGKKQKFAIPDASSFKCLDATDQNTPSTDTIELKYVDVKHEAAILDQIQKFKLAEELRQTPDPKLYDLLKQLLAARNMVKRDLATALHCPFQKITHYTPGTKRASGWNEFELKLLQWMQHNINTIKEEVQYATKNEISISNPDEKEQIEASAVDEAPIPSYEAYGTFEPDNYDEDDDWTNTNEDPKVFLPDSNLTRLSTPKYMLGSDEPTADLRLDPLPTFTRTLPQHNTGLELDFTYLPYLRPPKPTETTSTNEDQAGRVIYEKMLEAWQGNNEFQSQEKVIPSHKQKPFESPNQNGDKPRYSARKAAFIVLKNSEKPLSIKKIAKISIEQGYRDPDMNYNTMAAAISHEMKIQILNTNRSSARPQQAFVKQILAAIMTEVGNHTYSDTSDPSEVFQLTGSDLLATMEMVYGEALDPSIFQPDEVIMEDNSSPYEANEASSHQENPETNLRSSTVNEDRSARSEPIPQETPTEMKEVNTPSILIDKDATSQAEDAIETSIGATSKPVDESSVSVDYKASRPKRNARKVSQREEGRTTIERPTKKVKSLADLTPEQLEAMMELAQLPEHENLIIGDMKSPEDHQDTKNSPLEALPDPYSTDAKQQQQMSEPVKNNSEDEISKEVVIQSDDEKTSSLKILPRGKTVFMTERENDEYVCLECKAKDRTPWRFNRPYLIAAHVRKHQFSPHVFLDNDQICSDNDVEHEQEEQVLEHTTNDAPVADQQSNEPSEVDMPSTDMNIDLNDHQEEENVVEDLGVDASEVKDSAPEKSSDETDVPSKGKTTRARNANKPNQSIVKAMKETLKVLKKTQRQWANEMNVPEVELSKYFNDYYNPREWTSLEVILKNWLKENAPAHILRRFKTSLSLTRVEDGSTSRNNENDIGLDSYDNTKDRTDHQTTQEVIANSTKIPRLTGIDRALDVTSVKQKSTVSNNKAKAPLEYHEVLVLDLLQELNKVKNSASMNINDYLAVTESAHSVKNYLYGGTARTTRAAKYQQATAASL